MERNYVEYAKEDNIPDSYTLSCTELSDMYNSLMSGQQDAVFRTLCGIYKYGFERGRRYEKNRLKKKSKK